MKIASFCLLAAALLLSCSDDDDDSGGPAGQAGSTAGTSPGEQGGSAGTAASGAAGTSTGGSAGTSASGSAGTSASGAAGTTSGGSAGSTSSQGGAGGVSASDYTCKLAKGGRCKEGGGGSAGASTTTETCTRPTCHDGTVRASRCEGLPNTYQTEDPAHTWPCGAIPEGFFACGEQLCRLGLDYCSVITGSLGRLDCAPLPDTCAPQATTCDCLQAAHASKTIDTHGAFSTCEEQASGAAWFREVVP